MAGDRGDRGGLEDLEAKDREADQRWEEEVSSWPWRATGAWWWHTTGEPPDEARVTLDPNSRVMATTTPAGRLCAIALSAAGLLRRKMLDELTYAEELRFLRANNVDTSWLEHRLAEEVCKVALQEADLLQLDALNDPIDPDAAISLLKANNVDTSLLERTLADYQGAGEG
jgi:hypothetical protein